MEVLTVVFGKVGPYFLNLISMRLNFWSDGTFA